MEVKKASTTAIVIMLALLVCANVSEGQVLLDEPVARLGRGTIEDIAYSPDGNLLALGTSVGLCLLDGNYLANLGFMKGYSSSISSIAFSPDGKTIASNGGKTVLLWDIASKRKIADLEGHTDLVTSVAFSPDGRMIGSSGGEGVRLWDVDTRTQMAELGDNATEVSSIDFSPDGRLLALGVRDGVQLWDVEQRKLTAIFDAGIDRIAFSFAFSSDWETLALVGDEIIQLWDVERKVNMRQIHLPSYATTMITSFAFSPDGKYFAFSYFMIYPVLMGFETPPEHYTDFFALTPEGDIDEDIPLPHWWYIRSGMPLFWYMASPLAFSPDGTKMAIVGWSWLDEYSSVELWDTRLFLYVISISEENLPPVDAEKYRLAYTDSLWIEMPTTSVEPMGKVPFTWGRLKPVYAQRAVRCTKLLQNYPNPFNPETWIPFELALESEVVLRIHDAKGSLIREISLGKKPAGSYVQRSKAIHWDGRNGTGEQVSSGIYFYTIEAGDFTATRKMVVAD